MRKNDYAGDLSAKITYITGKEVLNLKGNKTISQIIDADEIQNAVENRLRYGEHCIQISNPILEVA